jgi:hypothetical protein
MDDLNGPVISYSIRDILERLEAKLDRKFADLTTAIGLKAESADLNQVVATQLNHDARLVHIEHTLENQAQRSGWRTEWRRWLTTTVLAAALTAVSIYQMVHG